MSDDKSTGTVDPLELWKRWNETTSRAWLNAMQNNVKATPYDMYHSWLQKAGENGNPRQEELKINPARLMDPAAAWKAWFDATMELWQKAAEAGGDPLGLTSQWLKIMEETRSKLLAGTPMLIDPFTLFKEWYDATSEQWSKAVEDAISSKQFLASTRPFMESFSLITNVFRQANVEYFKQLQLPTTLDIASVAELVVNLEEKVESLGDSLENIEEYVPAFATLEAVEGLRARLDQVATTEQLTSLEKRVEQSVSVKQFSSLEKRVEQLEHTLDKVLGMLEKIDAKVSATSHATPVRTTRKIVDKQGA